MAESTFDRARFASRLHTQRLGRTLITLHETGSTNDDAWAAAGAGAANGAVVVADAQREGRGRDGRSWSTPEGLGLAMSMLVPAPGAPRALASAPLAAGLALVWALESLGVATDLKWPNDVMASGRKLAGILCERRRLADGRDSIVIGAGVNVGQAEHDFPPPLRATAVSLAALGHRIAREDLAAVTLDLLEPLWETHARDPGPTLAAWRARAGFWGEPVVARTPAGDRSGIAETLDDDGALVLRLDSGERLRIVAGDVVTAPATRP